MRIGLIGCGNVGIDAHLPALAAVEGVVLVAAADPTPERLALAGGGVLMDMLHAVYLAGWFLGADPVAVSAFVDRRRDDGGDVEDWRDAVRDGRPLAASGNAGVTALSAVVGTYASAALGQEVALPLVAADPVYRRGALGIGEIGARPGSAVLRRRLFGLGRSIASARKEAVAAG